MPDILKRLFAITIKRTEYKESVKSAIRNGTWLRRPPLEEYRKLVQTGITRNTASRLFLFNNLYWGDLLTKDVAFKVFLKNSSYNSLPEEIRPHPEAIERFFGGEI
jgi:hypothetical protein